VPTLTSKSQVTVPREIRVALGIGPGTEVEFTLTEDGAILRKRVSIQALDRWQGKLRGRLPAGSVDELMDALRGERPLADDLAT
jgi:AbrB family looped-hinge helix DNA binding protein